MSKIVKEIMKKYKRLGFIFKQGSKHIIAVHSITNKIVVIARTPSDYRAYKNICKMLDNALTVW